MVAGAASAVAERQRPYRLPLDEVVPLFASLLSLPLDGCYAAPTLTLQ
jgi:hypothetical protein